MDDTVTFDTPCRKIGKYLTADTLAKFLDEAGEERFLTKVGRFFGDFTQKEPGQTLYEGIMVALGYAKNKTPFLKLARSLPLSVLESLVRCDMPDEQGLARQQAMLLGVGGLLPSQRGDIYQNTEFPDRWVDMMERLWRASSLTRSMTVNAWHLFRVRPNNSPVRRLVAMSYLLLRCREKGLLGELMGLINNVPDKRGGYRGLEKGLLVTTGGYWANHFDFGPGSRIGSPTLLGGGRIADIVVNVLLPFTCAWSQLTSQTELEREALDLYRRYPRLTANSVDRHMRQQLDLNSSLVNSAWRQQGLIHIYTTFCTQGKCDCCRLAR